jgi:hypothetical protein
VRLGFEFDDGAFGTGGMHAGRPPATRGSMEGIRIGRFEPFIATPKGNIIVHRLVRNVGEGKAPAFTGQFSQQLRTMDWHRFLAG